MIKTLLERCAEGGVEEIEELSALKLEPHWGRCCMDAFMDDPLLSQPYVPCLCL